MTEQKQDLLFQRKQDIFIIGYGILNMKILP